MKKSEKIILGVLALLSPLAVWEFVLSDSTSNGHSAGQSQTASQVAPAPEPASLKEYAEVTEEVAPGISERESTLEDLEYDVRRFALEARIAEHKKDRQSAEIEVQKNEAEVERILAEIERADLKAKLEQERARRQREREAEQAKRDEELAAMNRQQEKMQQVQVRAPETLADKKPTPSQASRPEVEATLLRVRGNRATVLVGEKIGEVAVGYPFHGIRVISVDEDEGAAVIEGRESGDRVDLMVSARSSRSFSKIRPLNPEAVSKDEEEELLGEETLRMISE